MAQPGIPAARGAAVGLQGQNGAASASGSSYTNGPVQNTSQVSSSQGCDSQLPGSYLRPMPAKTLNPFSAHLNYGGSQGSGQTLNRPLVASSPVPPSLHSGPVPRAPLPASQNPAATPMPSGSFLPGANPPPPLNWQYNYPSTGLQTNHFPHVAQPTLSGNTNLTADHQYASPGDPALQTSFVKPGSITSNANSGSMVAHSTYDEIEGGGFLGANHLTASMSGLSLHPEGLRVVNLLQERNMLPSTPLQPPVPNLHEDIQKLNCSPELFRCTLTGVPQTQALLNKAKLPLGLLLHPFKDLVQLPVVTSSTIVRCRSCRTYINPFVSFLDQRRWKCNLCYRVNDVPEEFMYNPLTRVYGEPHRRPEVQNATIEFMAPSEYMLRPPQPPVYLFVFDVSHNAIETGYLNSVCQSLLDNLDLLPGNTRTKIGFITFDSTIHFYSLQEGLSQPQMLIVSDIDDVFIPMPENLLVNLNESKEEIHLTPSTDFYKKLALDCSGQQAAVDLFLLSGQYSDLASLGCVSRYSAGSVYYYPSYHHQHNPVQVQKFQKELQRYLTRKIGFEAVMRIRCTKGLSIHTFHGNFFVRSTDLLSLPNVNPDAGYAVQMSVEESLTDTQLVSFQSALLYTSSKGERRIRVHTLCLPVVSTLNEVFLGADVQAISGLLANMAYRSSVLSSQQPGLMVPFSLRLFPLFVLALLKQKSFQTGTNARLDERIFAMCQVKNQPLVHLMLTTHPSLYRVDNLSDETDLPELDTPESARTIAFISWLREQRPFFPILYVIREESPMKAAFLQNLVEDRTESALSYYEFLLHVQQQVNK
ncbi:Protein transport protein Sec24A [Microtus ochrogaster]|uniref:Protein transport protein Sec24A n=1 Tax=Microtus ochrogaster TaxID=79684 RepID=A0A8J6GB00_MICOH|nr:Protein transport protein Sec24A [Microtus ochrogaster]